MSISIDGYSPVYHPTPALPEPQTEHDNSAADALAALQEAIAAAKRALEAARKAEAEAKKAQEALDKANEANRQALQSDYDAKKVTADQKWDDLKVATKEAYAAGGPQGQEKVTTQLKAIDSKDTRLSDVVDAAKAEKPDPGILASGNRDTDAAAKRVSNAYASGGEAGATKQLRTELESAKTPEERRAILRSAMPVVDKVTKELGANARRTEGDWEEKARTNAKDADKTGPIDTRSEFDHTVADLEASVELAGDKEAAFHIAHDILQVMPGGDRANSTNNLLGMLGLDLGQSSPNKTTMLETAMSAALVQPDATGPKDSMLAMPLAQRDQIARLLAPDRPTTVTIRDWTDDKGVKHDGTLWHEVEQNPDLLLSAQQRADIDKKTKGLSAGDVLKEKTGQAIENLRKQNPDKNVDNAEIGDTFTYKADDPRKDVPEPLAKDVQTAVDKSRGGHQGDLQYGVDLDKLTNSEAFHRLGEDQQAEAIGQFDRTITQSAKGGKPLGEDPKNQLRELIGSSTFHDVNPRVQNRVLGLFAEFTKNDAKDLLSGLNKLIGHASFRTLDDEAMEIQVLEGYQHDATFRGVVDKLVGRTDLQPADARTTLDQLSRVQANRQLYEKSNDSDKRKILDAVMQATTDPRFLGFNQVQRDQTIDQLVKDDGLHFALKGKEGLDKAFEIGAEAKPKVTTPQPEPGPAPKAPGTKEPEPTPGPTTGPSDVAAKPKEPAAPPQDTPPTADSVTTDLTKTQSGAHDVATSKETINDPLRKDAGEDPIRYAYLKLQDQHKGDKAYLKLLDEALPQHRRDYTTQQVKDLVAKNQPDQALDLLTTQLDGTKDPAERKQLWEAAGQPNFSRSYFDQQLDKVLDSKSLKKNEELAPLFNQIGEHAPPEAANLLLDAVKARIDKGRDGPMWHTLLIDADLKGQSYAGMMQLVERADSLGANRADEFAKFYVGAINEAMSDPQRRPLVFSLTGGGMPAGMFDQTKAMVGEHGAAKLSVALYNEMRSLKDAPMDWTDRTQTRLGAALRNGIEDFHEKVKGDVTDWQDQNKNALRLVQDYGGLTPDGVARAMVQDRKDHPFTYYHQDEDGKPAGVDAALAKMEQGGVQLDGLMRDLTKLKVNFDKPANPDEKRLGESIKSLDGDPLVMSTQKGNAALDEHRADQINYGNFAPADSPWNPAVITDVQRDHLKKLVRDNGISPELTAKINERTDRWETALKDELDKSDKVDDAKLQSLTEAYQKDLKELLKDKVANGGEGVMVKPPAEVVEHIKTTIQGAGTTTSTLRLTMNWFRDSGDSLLRAYTQVAFRRGLNGQGSFNVADDVVRNVARLGLSDEKSVNKAFDFMKKMQDKINELLPPGKTRLTPAEREKLIADFKREAPQFGPPKGFDPKAMPEAMKTSELVTRRLGMLCFLGSAVNNGVNAADEPGFTSSDLFAGLFGGGAVIELYRSSKGLEMQGGELKQMLQPRFGDNGAEQLSKYIKSNALGGLIAFADAAWAYEDFTGMTIGGNKAGEGDTTAGLLTSGVVMADLLELGAAGWRARLGTMAVAEGATIAGSSAAPVVGWVAAGLQAAFLGARFAYGVTKEKNKFEFEDNKDYADMVKSLGFTEHQARELMNQSGGNTDVKVNDWEWFVPGWNSYQSFHSLFGEGESFFQEGGMGPMHVLDPLFDANQVPQQQRLQFLQSLSPDEMKKLIGQTHKVLDDEMDDNGKISTQSLDGLEGWMRGNNLWKAEYLGTA